MRITGLIITSPDVAATQAAWRRLGTLDREIEVTPGEGGLAAVVLGVDDVAATERLLQRRGLDGDAGGFDLAGLTRPWDEATHRSELDARLAYADERKLARIAYDRMPDLARKEADAGRATPR